jgi:hypothetical protein
MLRLLLLALALAAAEVHDHAWEGGSGGGDSVHGDPFEEFHASLARDVLSGVDGHRHLCGSNHPNITALLPPETSVRQLYHTTKHAAERGLAVQRYATGVGDVFLPIREAHAANLTSGLRISFIWDLIDGVDFSPTRGTIRQCTAVGERIGVGCIISGAPSCTTLCTESDVIVPGNPRYELIKERLLWAAEFYSGAIMVKPVLDPIVLDANTINSYGVTTRTVPDADVAIIVTARPSPFAAVAAYASCTQRDQYGRCTVGVLNWVPSALIPERQHQPDSISAERHTALHEIVHILGGVGPSPVFIDDEGRPQTNVYVSVATHSTAYPKPTTYIQTPKVRAARSGHAAVCACGVVMCVRLNFAGPCARARALQLLDAAGHAAGGPASRHGCALGGEACRHRGGSSSLR